MGWSLIGLAVVALFALKSEIAEAKELLIELPDPEITRMEFDMKDQLIRQTIMSTQEDVAEIKEDMKRIEEKIDESNTMKNENCTTLCNIVSAVFNGSANVIQSNNNGPRYR